MAGMGASGGAAPAAGILSQQKPVAGDEPEGSAIEQRMKAAGVTKPGGKKAQANKKLASILGGANGG